MQDEKELVAGLPDDTPWDARIAAAVDALWRDQGIKQTYGNVALGSRVPTPNSGSSRHPVRGEQPVAARPSVHRPVPRPATQIHASRTTAATATVVIAAVLTTATRGITVRPRPPGARI